MSPTFLAKHRQRLRETLRLARWGKFGLCTAAAVKVRHAQKVTVPQFSFGTEYI